MSGQPTTLQLRVAEARELNPLIRLFRLRSPQGAALPGYTAGSHIRVEVALADGRADWRHYSLVNPVSDLAATEAPMEYVIAVRREADGRGGSRYMHERVAAGDVVTIEAPKNDFPLHADGGGSVLIAGGIGVTPLVSMAARLRAQSRPVRLHYAGRSRELMAFLPELESLLGDDLRIHTDAQAGGPLDVGALLDQCAPGERVYVCGPRPLLDAVLAQTGVRGWAPGRVQFELFSTAEAEAGDHEFEVELARTGRRFTVPAGRSILDCLIEQGCDPMFDCKRGECGVCSTPVLEGAIEHRDYVLTESEKAAGKVMQICVSRAKGTRLVLDI